VGIPRNRPAIERSLRLREAIRALLERHSQAQRSLTGKAVAAAIGCSERTARWHMQKIRWG
jgi:predicted transcriptional regulator